MLDRKCISRREADLIAKRKAAEYFDKSGGGISRELAAKLAERYVNELKGQFGCSPATDKLNEVQNG